jgi:NADH dehydrogenase
MTSVISTGCGRLWDLILLQIKEKRQATSRFRSRKKTKVQFILKIMKTPVPATNLPRIVIVGGGFGGITLARKLRKQACQIVMLDRHNYHTFQPLLYQVATGGLEPDSIAFPLRKVFEKQENFFFRMAEVESVDPEEKWIQTSIGAIRYDYLVVATGSKTNFFGLVNAEREAVGMKNIPEALDLRSFILQNFERANYEPDPEERGRLMKFVVVGGGPSGVETAGSLAELKRFVLPNDYPELDMRQMEIHLVEAGDQLLAGMSEKASRNALRALEKLGVHVWLNTFVKDYDGAAVITNKPLKFDSSTVIWTAGVKGATVQGIDPDLLAPGNRIRVDEYNRVNGYDGLYAIGDVAFMESEAYPKGHPGVAPVAVQQAENLGDNLKRILKGKELKAFSYYDKGTMATIGRNKAVVDWKGMHFKGIFAWLMWMFVHLLFLIGFRNRLVVFVNWVWSYFTYDKGTRLIIRPFRKKGVVVEV